MQTYTLPFTELKANDIPKVGGKNASLGEMINHLNNLGIKVPNGFATTIEAFHDFISFNNLDNHINEALKSLDVENIEQLTKVGKKIRQWIYDAQFSAPLKEAITQAFYQLVKNHENTPLAIRSSATAEDLPNASFAGQQETFLHICGLNNVLSAIKKVFSSLYNDRAISYREHQNFDHWQVGISAGIQCMVRSETSASGVMFTIDTESGFDNTIIINSSWGLGESVVQGTVNPDEFCLYKPNLQKNLSPILHKHLGSKKTKIIYGTTGRAGESIQTVTVPKEQQQQFSLTDQEIIHLGKQAILIEQHYKKPMDIEWAKDGDTGELFILQARPETVVSKNTDIEYYSLQKTGKVIISGRSIGKKIGCGKVRKLTHPNEMTHFQTGDVLVTDMTDPDWEPIMQIASAIVTNRGGRTCHAAIIARELGVPAVVGCNRATELLIDDTEVTVSCAEGDTGIVYEGYLDFSTHKHSIEKMPKLPIKIMMNVGNPLRAFHFAKLPNHGVGLARIEFIINQMIGIHPQALLEFNTLDRYLHEKIKAKIIHEPPTDFYINRLAEGISTIAASFAPQKVIIRFSDFKSNEYANLIGGNLYEPQESNPMLGFRGASRYLDNNFKACFELECQAILKARKNMGLHNIDIMVPFVRTVQEGEQVINLLNEYGLKSGDQGMRIIMMCELPNNALLAEEYLKYFDGFSIGSNDLTQLTLGIDRDSSLIAHIFDERNKAILILLEQTINACKKHNKYVGICGQGPSDYPDFAKWLVNNGIDTISLNPDTIIDTWLYLSKYLN